jgi:hypothetical protein
MALVTRSATDLASTAGTLAAPTVSETISAPTEKTYIVIVNGATASSVTFVVPGTDDFGVARPDVTIALPASAVLIQKIGRKYKDPATSNATMTFTNVTTVLACRLEVL